MSYQFNQQLKSHFLFVEISGNREKSTEADDALNVLKSVAESCNNQNVVKVIIVWDIMGAISPDQALILISNLKKYNWRKQFITASVHPYKENFESHQYTAKVAKTLNWNIRFFQDLEEAKNWITNIELSETVEGEQP
jgi:hypothetical protein